MNGHQPVHGSQPPPRPGRVAQPCLSRRSRAARCTGRSRRVRVRPRRTASLEGPCWVEPESGRSLVTRDKIHQPGRHQCRADVVVVTVSVQKGQPCPPGELSDGLPWPASEVRSLIHGGSVCFSPSACINILQPKEKSGRAGGETGVRRLKQVELIPEMRHNPPALRSEQTQTIEERDAVPGVPALSARVAGSQSVLW